jgi:hypothetical protein
MVHSGVAAIGDPQRHLYGPSKQGGPPTPLRVFTTAGVLGCLGGPAAREQVFSLRACTDPIARDRPMRSACSIRMFWPARHPNFCNVCTNAARRLRSSGSVSGNCASEPMRRICSGCCARAARGQAAAPPTTAINSRRFSRPNCIRCPQAESLGQDTASVRISQGLAAVRDFGPANVRVGSIARIIAPQHCCLLLLPFRL